MKDASQPAAGRLTPRWQELIELRPHDRDHWAAVRVGLATAIPLFALWALGRTDLAAFAVFGAFTSVFGRNFPHLSRLRLQSIAGIAQLLSIALGGAIALSPARNSIVILVGALWAFGASLLAARVRWTPPGPMFQVFGLASIAYIPWTPRQYGAGLIVAVSSIAIALLIGYVGRLIWRAQEGRLHNPYTKPVVLPPPADGFLQQAGLFFAGAGIAGAIPALIGIGHPYWAMVTAIAALSVPGGYNRVLRATHRFIGTMIGLGIGALLLLVHPSGLVVIIIIIALQAGTELFVVRNYSIGMVFITPLVLVMGELGGSQDLGVLIWQRAVETFIGVAVAVLIVLTIEGVGRSRRSGRGGINTGETDGSPAGR